MLTEQIWCKIPGFKNYSISTCGKVRNDIKGNELKTKVYKNYENFSLWQEEIEGEKKKRKKSYFIVHRLVAKLFIPKVIGKNWINHKDGNRLNNCVDNLEWCTPQENSTHACHIGLVKRSLTQIEVFEIMLLKKMGLKMSEIARKLNITKNKVDAVLKGKTYVYWTGIQKKLNT